LSQLPGHSPFDVESIVCPFFFCLLVVFASVLAYSLVGALIYVSVWIICCLLLTGSVIVAFWVMSCILVLLSKPAKCVGKDMEYRTLGSFAVDCTTKIINSFVPPPHQRVLLANYDEGLLERYVNKMRDEWRELNTNGALQEPLQQDMDITVQYSRKQILMKPHEPIGEQLLEHGYKYSKRISHNNYEINPWQSLSHYSVHDDAEIKETEGGEFRYEDCRSKFAHEPTCVMKSAHSVKYLSSTWFRFMLAGPLCLIFVLGLATYIPLVSTFLWLQLAGDVSWKTCGPYSRHSISCTKPSANDTGIVLHGCQCMQCNSVNLVKDTNDLICPPILNCSSAAHHCYGYRPGDLAFPAVDGTCDCSRGLLTFQFYAPPKMWDDNYVAYEDALKKVHLSKDYPVEVDLFIFDWNALVRGIKSTTTLLRTVYLDTIAASVKEVLLKNQELREFLVHSFYTTENLAIAVLGWTQLALLNWQTLFQAALLSRSVTALGHGVMAILK